MELKIWICPTEGCGNYFGTKNSEDQPLQSRVVGDRGINGERFGPERHRLRSVCPDCFEAGRGKVERVQVTVLIDLKDAASATYDEPVGI